MLFYRRQILVETGVVDKNLKDFTVCLMKNAFCDSKLTDAFIFIYCFHSLM